MSIRELIINEVYIVFINGFMFSRCDIINASIYETKFIYETELQKINKDISQEVNIQLTLTNENANDNANDDFQLKWVMVRDDGSQPNWNTRNENVVRHNSNIQRDYAKFRLNQWFTLSRYLTVHGNVRGITTVPGVQGPLTTTPTVLAAVATPPTLYSAAAIQPTALFQGTPTVFSALANPMFPANPRKSKSKSKRKTVKNMTKSKTKSRIKNKLRENTRARAKESRIEIVEKKRAPVARK